MTCCMGVDMMKYGSGSRTCEPFREVINSTPKLFTSSGDHVHERLHVLTGREENATQINRQASALVTR